MKQKRFNTISFFCKQVSNGKPYKYINLERSTALHQRWFHLIGLKWEWVWPVCVLRVVLLAAKVDLGHLETTLTLHPLPPIHFHSLSSSSTIVSLSLLQDIGCSQICFNTCALSLSGIPSSCRFVVISIAAWTTSDWLTERLIDWFVDWLIDWLIDWFPTLMV